MKIQSFFISAISSVSLILATSLLNGCSTTAEETDPTLSLSAEAMYALAKTELNKENYGVATKLYEKFESRYPYGNLANQAQLDVAYAYYKQRELDAAIAAADRFIQMHPTHPRLDYAYYIRGLSNFLQDDSIFAAISRQDYTERDPQSTKIAYETFKILVTRWPNSPYAEEAYRRMTVLVDALAEHEMHAARYYRKREAYMAVIGRSKFLIENYPTAPQREDALALMIDAYDKMGMTDLRDDTKRVLILNYPDSRFLKSSGATIIDKKKPWWQLW